MMKKYFVPLLLFSIPTESKFLRNENYPHYLFSFENQTFVARPRNFTDDNYHTYYTDEFFFDIGF